MGRKNHLKCSKIKVTNVPQYKGLAVRNILKFARSKTNIDEYLPEYDYSKEPNRSWLCNIVNTIIEEEFQNFIQIMIEERRKTLIESQNLGITAKHEFINIFRKSNAVSTVKGKSHFLARVPKLTNDKIKIAKLAEEKKEELDKKLDAYGEIRRLKNKL